MVKRIKILLYSCNFAPESIGIGKYSGEMAEWLAEQGHSVRVVAAPPYYPMWKVDSAYRFPFYRRELWRGVEILRAPIWVPQKPGGLARVLHLLSFAIASFPIMIRQVFWRPDLVVSVAPAFVCAPIALLTASLCGARKWLHLQDFEVDLAFQMSFLKGRILQSAILRVERWIFSRFDHVSSISRRMMERLHSKGVDPKRTRYLPNWVDISHIRPSLSGTKYRELLGIAADTLVVLYSGSLGGKQGLMIIPAVATLLAARKDVVFVVCGDGVLKQKIQSASLGLPNIHFLPLQPYETLGQLLCMADMHLLSQSVGAADLVLPSKLSGMLASGRPVIAACRSGTEIDAVVSQCGLVVPPQDIDGMAAAICKLVDDPRMRVELGRRARAYAESSFEREAILGKVFGQLDADLQRVVDNAVA